jgi:hypothetical protein
MLYDLRERWTQVFVDLFAANVFHFGDGYQGGGPGYYGVRVENVAADGSELELVLTFRSGKRYCCFEFCDHFAFYRASGWCRLRQCMDRHGLAQFSLPVIRKVWAVIEKGAVVHPSPTTAVGIWEGSEYHTGPFLPLSEDGALLGLPQGRE